MAFTHGLKVRIARTALETRMEQTMPLKRTEKLVLMLDEVELKVLDDWRYLHRMPSRAAAVRALMELGYVLDAQNSQTQTAADPGQCGTAASSSIDKGTPAL